MTQDDIIRMAREVGLRSAVLLHIYKGEGALLDSELNELRNIERFATLVAAAEREACADICDQHASVEGIAQRCAEQIRARSKT
jgi:hypothetical protein